MFILVPSFLVVYFKFLSPSFNAMVNAGNSQVWSCFFCTSL
uniref:Uncharacterized protein n=1 Tax=Anguilla anguilla TaxID=7936 RepID=A0A0E9QAV4_ANGAN